MTDENTSLNDFKAVTLRRITRRNYRKIAKLKIKPNREKIISWGP